MKINGYEIKPGAHLRGVDLRCANLRNADLMGADLSGSILWSADLRNANLKNADLRGADLSGANLEYAIFRYAFLFGAKLEGATLPHFQIVPEEGSFIAYKKVNTGVIKLLIPEDAKRTSNLIGRKCRASHVKVLEGSGKSMTHIEHQLEYKEGEIVYADKYDDDIRIECTSGIHFFMTRREAEEY